MDLHHFINKTLKHAFNLIFPIECLGCRKEDAWLCEKCLSLIQLNEQRTCPICNQENFFHGQVCPDCQKNYYLDKIFIAAAYENELVQKMIKIFKYNFVRDLKKPLADIMITYLRKHWDSINQLNNYSNNLIVIPSPLSKKRLRWRGFNQSELLSQEISEKLQLTYLPNLIIKRRNTKEQAALNREQRLVNVKDVFVIKKDCPKIKGQSFLIIDDVITTGATLGEIAKVLKNHGAKEVWAMVVAKN